MEVMTGDNVHNIVLLSGHNSIALVEPPRGKEASRLEDDLQVDLN